MSLKPSSIITGTFAPPPPPFTPWLEPAEGFDDGARSRIDKPGPRKQHFLSKPTQKNSLFCSLHLRSSRAMCHVFIFFLSPTNSGSAWTRRRPRSREPLPAFRPCPGWHYGHISVLSIFTQFWTAAAPRLNIQSSSGNVGYVHTCEPFGS